MDDDRIRLLPDTMETKRLLLRQYRESDAEDMFEYARDPEVTKYLTWDTHTSVEESVQAIRTLFSEKNGAYAIELKEEEKVVGCIDLKLIAKHNKGSLGYVLNRNYWGKGIMTEALTEILRLAFDVLELNRVEALHVAENPASGRVMAKCGMRYEGLARQEVFCKGRYEDLVHYGILRTDVRG